MSLSSAALATDFRASADCVCERCGGPIATGDRIVHAKGGAWHRSCSFVQEKDVAAFRRKNRAKKTSSTPPAADPRQLSLFGVEG